MLDVRGEDEGGRGRGWEERILDDSLSEMFAGRGKGGRDDHVIGIGSIVCHVTWLSRLRSIDGGTRFLGS